MSTIKKLIGKKVGGVQPIKPVEEVKKEEQLVEQTEAQKKAALARTRFRTGRAGRRSLLAAGRLGGGRQGQDQQDTLGAA